MTSTPEVPEGAAHEHHIPEPEAGEAELPESAAVEPSHDAPLDHASAHGADDGAEQDGAEQTDAEQTDATQAGAEQAIAEQADAGEAPADIRAQQPAPEPTTPTLEELELALAALDEVAPKGAVGEVQDALLEGGAAGQAQVVAIRHASTLGGYPDWSWTVLLSRGLEGGPTVLEVALLPGETSLLAPAWVPWSERLADYLAAKESAGADGDDEDDDEELESDLEADLEDDFDDDFDVEDAVDHDADDDGDDDDDHDDDHDGDHDGGDDDDDEWDDDDSAGEDPAGVSERRDASAR